MQPRPRWQLFLILILGAALVFFADQVHKSLVVSESFNTGVSFGLGAGWQGWPWFTCGILAMLTVWLTAMAVRFLWKWWGWLGIGMVLGGGLSNWLDRAVYGAVRDPLRVPFTSLNNNLADYAIFIGILAVVLCFATVGERKNVE